MQGAQVFGIGRRNVDGDVAGVVVDFGQTGEVVIHGIFNRGGGIFTNVNAQDALEFGAFDIGNQRIDAVVIETHAVDDGLVLRQAEQTWLGIAVLWTWGDGANFDETKTQSRQCIDVFAILVQTCGQANWVFQGQTH